MGDKVFKELRSVLESIKPVKRIDEAVTPVAARNIFEKAKEIRDAFGSAARDFATSRDRAYDVAVTFGLDKPTGTVAKGVPHDITKDDIRTLEYEILKMAKALEDRFEDVLRMANDMQKSELADLREAASGASDLTDEDLVRAAAQFRDKYKTFNALTGRVVYGLTGGVVKRSEELKNRITGETHKLTLGGGRSGKPYPGHKAKSPGDVKDHADEIVSSLKRFSGIAPSVHEDIESLKSYVTDAVKELATAAPVEATNKPKRGRPVKAWLSLPWEDDPEMATFI